MLPAVSQDLQLLVDKTAALTRQHLLPRAEQVDREGRWPGENLRLLAREGLGGLTAPRRVGGQGQGLLATALVTETLGAGCASTAMCFGMHCVATAVLAAKATPDQDERYLVPIAQGRHLSSLALSEAGTGSNFFISETGLRLEGAHYVINGVKQFVTSGGEADSYVLSTLASDAAAVGEFSCLVVDRGTEGMQWSEPWDGLGMRGNSSRGLTLRDVRVPKANLLGAEGDQTWFVFEVVAPFFLIAMAGTYVGVARAALELAVDHLKTRRFSHSGGTVGDLDTPQHRVGELWAAVERARLMVHQAAALGDSGSPHALASILACKAEAADAAVRVTNEAMTLCGGAAYRENSTLGRLLRDARASHVMAPTTDMLRLWTGRHVLGLSLF